MYHVLVRKSTVIVPCTSDKEVLSWCHVLPDSTDLLHEYYQSNSIQFHDILSQLLHKFHYICSNPGSTFTITTTTHGNRSTSVSLCLIPLNLLSM